MKRAARRFPVYELDPENPGAAFARINGGSNTTDGKASPTLYRQTRIDQRNGEKRKADTWSIRYRQGGEIVEEWTGQVSRRAAAAMLELRLAQVERGTDPTFDELADDLLAYMERVRPRSRDTVRQRLRHLWPVFGRMKAGEITDTMIERYRARRREEGAAGRTVTNEIRVLRRALRLAPGVENKTMEVAR